MDNSEFNAWLKEFSMHRLPQWGELPDLNLYMDQVTSEIDKNISFILDKQITKSMINSYVKMNAIDKPIKKKYSRKHLAAIIVVSIMKQAFPLDTIKKGIIKVFENESPEVAYNNFVALFNKEMELIGRALDTGLGIGDDQLIMAQELAIKTVIYQEIVKKISEYDKQ